jgi:serum/glucocorticoid-regulated kinase 2
VDKKELKDDVVTKPQASILTREDILKRKKELMAQRQESDDEDENEVRQGKSSKQVANRKRGSESGWDEEEEAKDTITGMIENHEKVRIEDFELIKVLGRGSFGKVIQVRMKGSSDGKIYAMKILRKRTVVARSQIDHTKAERALLQALQHPFLMTLRYAFQSKEKLYFVMDYFQGGELFFHLKKMRWFPEDVCRIYVAEIGMAIGHLHSLGYIYRDLKPENILLDYTGHVCLADFGLAKDVDGDGKTHTFCGTPEYLAPEIIAGVGHDKAVDWWAVGILLYELAVGMPPFYHNNVNEMYNRIQTATPKFPPQMSEACRDLIHCLLVRNPQKRFGSQNDWDEIKRHPFFASLDLNKLLRKEIDVPYKPKLQTGSATDTSQFDKEFTDLPAVDSVVESSHLAAGLDQNMFQGFTFQPSKPSVLGSQ